MEPRTAEPGLPPEPGSALPWWMAASAIGTLWLVGGLVYPMLAVASDELNAVQLTAVRTTGAAIMTTPLLVYRLRGRISELWSLHSLWPNVVAGVLFYPIGNGLLTYGSARLPSAISALAFSLLPVLAASVAAYRGHRYGRRVWLGVAGACVSMVGVVGAPDAAVALLPLLAVLASVTCWFVGTEFWARRGRRADLMVSVWLQLVIGACACWVTVALASDGPPSTGQLFSPLLLLLAFSQFIQHAAYLGIAGRVNPLLLTSFAFVNPVVAAVAGYLLLQQQLTVVQTIASLAMLLSVSVVVKPSRT